MVEQPAGEDLELHKVLQAMSEGFAVHEIILDSQGKPCDYRFLEVNEAFEKLTGLAAAQVLGKTVKEVLPAIEDYWIETYGKVALTGEPARFESYAASLGKWFQVCAYSPGKNKFVALFIDIVKRKRTELALERTHRALRVLSKCNQVVIRSTDEQQLLNEVCRLAVEEGGYRLAWVGFAEQDEVRTVRPVAYYGFEDGYLDKIKITWSDNESGSGPTGTAIRTGKPYVVREISKEPVYFPWRDQALKRGYASLISLPLAIDGKILGAIDICAGEADAFDQEEVTLLTELADDLSYGITAVRTRRERDLTLEKLQQSEERLRLVLESVPQGVTVTDLDGRIIQVNSAVLKMHGYGSEPELLGQSAFILIAKEDHIRAAEIMRKTLETGASGVVEYLFARKDGSIFPTELSAATVRNASGQPVGFVAVTEDVSERHNMIEKMTLQDRLAAIGELVSGVAHEINNPLTGVIGFSEMLLKRELPKDVKEDLKVINEESRRIAGIVGDLITFARRPSQEKAAVDINQILQRVLTLRAYEQKLNNITVVTDFAPDIAPVQANASQLQQVFLNLVVNAEYSMAQAHGRGTLRITTRNIGDRVSIAITDDGLGIAPENMKRLFTPFFTTKPEGKGTGLGLSVSHGIVTEHGGNIWAESEVGKGATFFVELPATGHQTEKTGQSG